VYDDEKTTFEPLNGYESGTFQKKETIWNTKHLRELPKNNLHILLALLPVFYVVTTGT